MKYKVRGTRIKIYDEKGLAFIFALSTGKEAFRVKSVLERFDGKIPVRYRWKGKYTWTTLLEPEPQKWSSKGIFGTVNYNGIEDFIKSICECRLVFKREGTDLEKTLKERRKAWMNSPKKWRVHYNGIVYLDLVVEGMDNIFDEDVCFSSKQQAIEYIKTTYPEWMEVCKQVNMTKQ